MTRQHVGQLDGQASTPLFFSELNGKNGVKPSAI